MEESSNKLAGLDWSPIALSASSNASQIARLEQRHRKEQEGIGIARPSSTPRRPTATACPRSPASIKAWLSP